MILAFESWWYILAGVLLLLTVVNGVFVYQLHKTKPDLLDRVGNPSFLFFATGGWLTSRRFTKFLLSRASREALSGSPPLLFLSRSVAGLYILMLLALLASLISLVVQRA